MGLIGSIRPPSLLQGTVMEVSLADPHAMQDAGELAGESDLRTLRTATLGQAHPPRPSAPTISPRALGAHGRLEKPLAATGADLIRFGL